MVLLFGTTLFVSATLLFLVQPMVGKMRQWRGLSVSVAFVTVRYAPRTRDTTAP
jgi:hypothetical protein